MSSNLLDKGIQNGFVCHLRTHMLFECTSKFCLGGNFFFSFYLKVLRRFSNTLIWHIEGLTKSCFILDRSKAFFLPLLINRLNLVKSIFTNDTSQVSFIADTNTNPIVIGNLTIEGYNLLGSIIWTIGNLTSVSSLRVTKEEYFVAIMARYECLNSLL